MREVVKKVIAYMTLGIDVSRLFSEMVLATQNKDIIIKKMVYLYLCTYCKENEELAILVINTLHKDWYTYYTLAAFSSFGIQKKTNLR